MPADEPGDSRWSSRPTAYAFSAGHRIRLALAGTDWPNSWPPPTPVALTLDRAALRFDLPVLHRATGAARAPLRATAEQARGSHDEDEPRPVWRLEHDVLARDDHAVVDHGATYRVALAVMRHRRLPGTGPRCRSAIRAGRRPAPRCRFELAWPDVTCAVEPTCASTAIPTASTSPSTSRDEDGAPFASREWRESIPRDLL